MKQNQTILKNEKLLTLMEDAIIKAGCNLTYDDVPQKGGLALVKGEKRFIINQFLSTQEKIDVISENLRKMDLGDIFLLPIVRNVIEE